MSRGNRVAGVAGRAALLLASVLIGGPRAQAQWGGGYGFGAGYGFGGWGGGFAGPFGGMGMNLYEQQAVKDQYYMLGMSRFNLQNAEANANYQAANLMQQRAVTAALENQRLSYQMAKERYDVRTQQAASSQAMQTVSTPQVPLASLVDDDGRVVWPDYAPAGGSHGQRRQQADEAIAVIARAARDGVRVPVADLVAAKARLHDYGQPALDQLRARRDGRTRAELLQYLRALDAALDGAGAPPDDAPDDAPARD